MNKGKNKGHNDVLSFLQHQYALLISILKVAVFRHLIAYLRALLVSKKVYVQMMLSYFDRIL